MNKVLSLFSQEWFKNNNLDIPEELEVHFVKALNENEIIAACQKMDYLFFPSSSPLITARVIQNVPSIKMIQSAGIGFDKVDIKAAKLLKIPVCNSPGDNAGTVAEFTIAQLITLQRRFFVADREIKAGNYQATRELLINSGLKEMCDIRLGLVGFGTIGKRVARLSRACGSRVSYYDPFRADEKTETEYQVDYLPLKKLLSSCDAITLHLPLNDQTYGIIGQNEIDLMPAGSLLLNTSRGELVDQNALARALENGHLYGAAMDTFDPEPLPAGHPLLNLSVEARDRLLMTPHTAGITRGSLKRLITAALDNIVRAMGGEKPKNIVNNVGGVR